MCVNGVSLPDETPPDKKYQCYYYCCSFKAEAIQLRILHPANTSPQLGSQSLLSLTVGMVVTKASGFFLFLPPRLQLVACSRARCCQYHIFQRECLSPSIWTFSLVCPSSSLSQIYLHGAHLDCGSGCLPTSLCLFHQYTVGGHKQISHAHLREKEEDGRFVQMSLSHTQQNTHFHLGGIRAALCHNNRRQRALC